MGVNKKLERFLAENKIKYDLVSHKKVFTAFDKAATLKVRPKTVGKTLVIKIDKNFAIVLIPANKNFDKGKFKKAINKQRKKNGLVAAKNIDFATERWIKKNLKGAKIGAVPPFGQLWKSPTLIEKSFLKEKEVFLSSGDYSQSLKVSPKIFQKLNNFVFGVFGKPR